MEINKITGAVVDTAYRIHEEVGPGLLESVYELVLADMLVSKGFGVADIIVEGAVIVEIKSIEELARVHKSNC
jgi:hypothetical protein